MIQRERERRQQLHAEEERQRLAEAAQNKAERQKFAKRRESAGAENRRFLEELKTPEYLQAIIDEVKLDKAYVLWWLKHPGSREGHGELHAYKKALSTYDSAVLNLQGYIDNDEPFYTRMSLVWDIGYIESFSIGTGRMVETSHGWGYQRTAGGSFPDGYAFKAVNVEGSAEKGLVVIHAAHKMVQTPGGSFLRDSWELDQKADEIILSRDQVDQPGVLEKTLASVCVDTSSFPGLHFEVRSGSHKNSWPFDKQVPEQETKSSHKYYAVRISI